MGSFLIKIYLINPSRFYSSSKFFLLILLMRNYIKGLYYATQTPMDTVNYKQNQWATDHYTRTNAHININPWIRFNGEDSDEDSQEMPVIGGSPTYGVLPQAHSNNMEIVGGPYDTREECMRAAAALAEAERAEGHEVIEDPSQIYHWNPPLPEPECPQHLEEPEEPNWDNQHWGAPNRNSHDALEAIFLGVALKERATICAAYARYCRALSKAQMPFIKRRFPQEPFNK